MTHAQKREQPIVTRLIEKIVSIFKGFYIGQLSEI